MTTFAYRAFWLVVALSVLAAHTTILYFVVTKPIVEAIKELKLK